MHSKKQTHRSILLLWAAIFSLFAVSCNETAPVESAEQEITIAVDENYQPIIDTELMVWHEQAKRGKIYARYLPEREVMRLFMNDSTGLVVLSRPLTASEHAYFKQKGFNARETHVGHDGIALITHPDNPVTAISLSQLHDLLTKENAAWKDINPAASGLSAPVVVFDHQESSTVRYALDSICLGDPLARNVSAANSNTEVIEYVKKNKQAIGIIGVNWISDLDRPTVRQFREGIRVLSVSRMKDGEAFLPYQAHLVTKQYPLSRNMYIINGESMRGLESNFASFVYGERGQRIILKSGLVPANAPTRVIKFKPEHIQVGK